LIYEEDIGKVITNSAPWPSSLFTSISITHNAKIKKGEIKKHRAFPNLQVKANFKINSSWRNSQKPLNFGLQISSILFI